METLSLPFIASWSLTGADLDGDGDGELIVASTGGGGYWLVRHQGNGRFSHDRYSGETGNQFVAADLNGDALPELSSALPPEHRKVSILRNRRGGIIRSSRTFVPTGDQPFSVVSGDFDGDGRPDLATASTDNSVAVLLNRSPPPPSADRDGDGLPDECARPAFHRGDPNGDGASNLSDAVHLLDFLFAAGPAAGCRESADADNDGQVDLSDPIALLNYLFLAGAPLAAPGAAPLPCGSDPDPAGSAKDLGCGTYDACRA